jgi:hypothetical protein
MSEFLELILDPPHPLVHRMHGLAVRGDHRADLEVIARLAGAAGIICGASRRDRHGQAEQDGARSFPPRPRSCPLGH